MNEHQILIVDDDAQYLRLVRCIMEKEGVIVHYATNGQDALGILEGNCCTLMMTDMKMSGMSGLTLSTTVKQLYPDIVIVMVTGEYSIGAASAASAGISKVIYKPCRADHIREIARGNLHC